MSHPWDDKWLLGDKLGKGGQGQTWLVAGQADSSQQGCLKTLRNNKNAQARGRMLREVANLQSLADSGGSVPRVIDHNTQDYENLGIEMFVVMEYVPGPTLRKYVDTNGPLGVDEAIEVAMGLCETIKVAHSFPIVHRDLKPENLILKDGDPSSLVVVDYGLSFNAIDADITQTNETFRNKFLDLPETNTPGGNRRDPRSDITAACGVFCYLLTGHVPGQLSGADGLPPHKRAGFSIAETLREPDQVKQLELVFDRGFQANVANRFQTIEELIDRLEFLRASSADGETPDPIEIAAASSTRMRENDRATQLAEFGPTSGSLGRPVKRFVDSYSGKLGRFRLSHRNNVPMPKRPFLDGVDRVGPLWSVTISVEHHPQITRSLVVGVGSKGEQCVVASMPTGESAANTAIDCGEAKELIWVRGGAPIESELIELHLRAWLARAVEELTEVVLAGS